MVKHDPKTVVHRLMDIGNSGDLDQLDELLSPDVVYRTSGYPEMRGIDAWRAFVEAARSAFPDIKATIDKITAEGDTVTYRYTYTGTHRGEWLGIEPTGRRISVEVISMDRVVDGKVVESIEVSDTLDILQQLGVIEKDLVTEGRL